MNTTEKTSTEQVEKRDEHGRFVEGHKPSVGFHTHPENRNPGGWKKEDSISYQYNKFMRMTAEEVREWEVEYPEDKRTMAMELAYRAILRARKQLKDLQEITDRTEGKAPQTIVHEGGFFTTTKLQIEEVQPAKINSDDTQIKSEAETNTQTT